MTPVDDTNWWTLLLWIVVITILLCAAAYVCLKWMVFRIAARVAAEAEHRLAAAFDAGAAQVGRAGARLVPDDVRRDALRQIDRLAWLMDNLVRVPVIGGLGLDALLGLVPVAGDAISLAVSSLIVIRAAQIGVPREVLARILAIMATDFLLGSIPVGGDVFDAVYRADLRAAAIVREWASRTPTR
jgi:hypothetical protein